MSYAIPTLAELVTWLRSELNDTLASGNASQQYADTDLAHFLNRAKEEAELVTRCHKERVEVELTEEVHTYSVAPIFEPAEASYGGATLTVVKLGDMASISANWDASASGTPTHLLHLSGSQMRVWPSPDAVAAKDPLVVHGFAVSGALGQACTMEEGHVVTCPGHGLEVGECLSFVSGGGGVRAGVTYHVKAVLNEDMFTFSETEGGEAFDITSQASNVIFTDAVTSLPCGLATATLLEGAKAFAYKARGNNPINLQLAAGAEAKFALGCSKIVEAIKAGAA